MRRSSNVLFLLSLALVLFVGCGGGVDDDLATMRDSPESLKKTLKDLSVDELEARTEELKKRGDALEAKFKGREPTDAEQEEFSNLVGLGIAYQFELMSRKK